MKNHAIFAGKVLLVLAIANAVPAVGAITQSGNKFFK